MEFKKNTDKIILYRCNSWLTSSYVTRDPSSQSMIDLYIHKKKKKKKKKKKMYIKKEETTLKLFKREYKEREIE
jgi:hypothetical protein